MRPTDLRISNVELPSGFGFGFLTGPQMLVIHAGWWHWRIDWTGRFADDWRPTRPIRKGEIPKGELYEFTKHRGLNPHVNAAKRDKYHYMNEKKQEDPGWLRRLARWLRRSPKK